MFLSQKGLFMKNARFITVKEISDNLGCNVNYVYDLIAIGLIKNFKVGRGYKIMRVWYEEFLVYAETHDLPSYETARLQAVAARKERSAA